MDVIPGYKRTEVGLIPEDWNVSNLETISADPMQNGLFFQPARKGQGVRIINVGDLYTRAPIDSASLNLFDATNYEKERFKVEDGDLFFTRSSIVPSGIAQCNIYKKNEPEIVVFDSHVIRVRPDRKKVNNVYIFRFLNSLLARSYFVSHAKSAIMTTIDQGVLGNCPVLLPPPDEQQAIAEALSDVDALIESLEQLIAKKRQVKQGAMQELLSPNERWVEKRLGNTAVLKARIGWQGLTTREYLDSGEFYLITGTEFADGYIDWENCNYVDEWRYRQDKNIQVREQDILVTKDGTIGKVALVNNFTGPATLNSGVFVIRPINDAFYPPFFYYLLLSRIFIEFLKQLSAGSTINHLYQKDFVNFMYKTPETIDEQIWIANILSDMDAEIVGLEAKLKKAIQVKQGMMQELLTGRIRLV